MKTDEEILEEAKKLYPIGTIFKAAHSPNTSSKFEVTKDNYLNIHTKGLIAMNSNKKQSGRIDYLVVDTNTGIGATIFYNNKWAPIIGYDTPGLEEARRIIYGE